MLLVKDFWGLLLHNCLRNKRIGRNFFHFLKLPRKLGIVKTIFEKSFVLNHKRRVEQLLEYHSFGVAGNFSSHSFFRTLEDRLANFAVNLVNRSAKRVDVVFKLLFNSFKNAHLMLASTWEKGRAKKCIHDAPFCGDNTLSNNFLCAFVNAAVY